MPRAAIACFAVSVILLTLSCAKPESNIPPAARSGQSTGESANSSPDREREARQQMASTVESGSEAGKQGRNRGAPERPGPAAGEASAGETVGKTQEAAATEAAATESAATEAAKTDESKESPLAIAGGALQMNVPQGWNKTEVASNMIEIEFSVPNEGELASGRVTGSFAGGGVELNVTRWYGQFTQPDGSETKDHAKQEELNVGDLKIHKVELSGTFLEGMGPLAPKTEREDYRMLAAIVEMDGGNDYFLKFTGPAALVEKNAEAFSAMLQSLKPVD